MRQLTRALCLLLLAAVAASARADFLPPVTANGLQWLQPKDFVNLRWIQIRAVCDPVTGECNGSLLGNDLTGWTWASYGDVAALFNSLVEPDCVQSDFNLVQGNILCAPGHAIVSGFLELFEPTLGPLPPNADQSVYGYVRSPWAPQSSVVMGAESFTSPLLCGSAVGATCDYFRRGIVAETESFGFIGAWFFREADTSSQPVTAVSTLPQWGVFLLTGLLGLTALLGLRHRTMI